jgi:hypothetical protein
MIWLKNCTLGIKQQSIVLSLIYNVFVCGVNTIKYKIEEKHYYKYNNFIEIYIHTKYKLFNGEKKNDFQ